MALFRKYDHIFFDLDNTLWDFDRNARLALEETFYSIGTPALLPAFEHFYAFFIKVNHRLWEAYRKKKITQQLLIRERFAQTLGHFGLNGTDPENLNAYYLQQMPAYSHLVEGAEETLIYLQAQGYHLHVITNGLRSVQQSKLVNSKLNRFIEKLICSEDAGTPKPDKAIFRHALKNCNARKNRSLMIGDNWETDIEGARQAGINAVYFLKNTCLPESTPNHILPWQVSGAVPRIRELTELIETL
ncbi:MAG: YjjG family noncanonical pyrimidine nucleotidase [Mangrovibacterium sp.]